MAAHERQAAHVLRSAAERCNLLLHSVLPCTVDHLHCMPTPCSSVVPVLLPAKGPPRDSVQRTALKSVTWRILSTATTISLALFIFSDSIAVRHGLAPELCSATRYTAAHAVLHA